MHLLTLFWERPHLLLIQMRQICIDRNECILLACNVGIILIYGGHWAHPGTRLEGVRGNPHLGTRESVLGRMRWLLRHSKRILEGLINNNNNNCRSNQRNCPKTNSCVPGCGFLHPDIIQNSNFVVFLEVFEHSIRTGCCLCNFKGKLCQADSLHM